MLENFVVVSVLRDGGVRFAYDMIVFVPHSTLFSLYDNSSTSAESDSSLRFQRPSVISST